MYELKCFLFFWSKVSQCFSLALLITFDQQKEADEAEIFDLVFLRKPAACKELVSLFMYCLKGSFSNEEGDGNENVTWKCNFAQLLLLRDYSNSFNLYNVGEVSRN